MGDDNYKLSDGEAKRILLSWPRSTKKLWSPPGGEGAWVRAQPSEGGAAGPKIFSPGAKLFSTQPDGLWVHFSGLESCDVVAVEICGSIQNLNDKRSRYMPSTLVLRVPRVWADSDVPARQGAGRSTMRGLAGTLPEYNDIKVNVPIRVLRVLYALPNVEYKKWVAEHVPTGYEYFMPHGSLSTYGRKETQDFLKGMSVASQFHTVPANVRVPK